MIPVPEQYYFRYQFDLICFNTRLHYTYLLSALSLHVIWCFFLQKMRAQPIRSTVRFWHNKHAACSLMHIRLTLLLIQYQIQCLTFFDTQYYEAVQSVPLQYCSSIPGPKCDLLMKQHLTSILLKLISDIFYCNPPNIC